MSYSQRAATNEAVVDDYPVRPNTVNQDKIIPSSESKSQHRNIVLLSLIYFLYGSGISIYGPLYPSQARKNDLNSCIYGSVIGTSHFVSVLFYPIACQMVSKVSSRNALSVSVFVIGSCRILFGTLNIIFKKVPFIAISYSIQAVEGIGISILIASTVISSCTVSKNQMQKMLYSLQASMCLGLMLGPIGGQVVKKELGFDIPFYVIGGLTVFSFIILITLLKKSEQQIPYADIPIVFWMKDKRMLIYFFIVFASFNYVGFLSVSLEYILKQFHLNYFYVALVFSISPFIYGLSAPGWMWLIRKGFNNVMLVFIGAILILASLVLLGPAPYTSLEASFSDVCWALILEGIGISCKSVCILDASAKDLSHQKKYSEIQRRLVFPTVFLLGACLGYFCGSVTAGFADFYIGFRKATLPLLGLEICTAIVAVILAMNRRYIGKSRRGNTEENEPILRS